MVFLSSPRLISKLLLARDHSETSIRRPDIFAWIVTNCRASQQPVNELISGQIPPLS